MNINKLCSEIMRDGIARIVNELDEQSTFQMALFAFRPSCPLGFLADQRKAIKNIPSASFASLR
jgi:hypothetical protein